MDPFLSHIHKHKQLSPGAAPDLQSPQKLMLGLAVFQVAAPSYGFCRIWPAEPWYQHHFASRLNVLPSSWIPDLFHYLPAIPAWNFFMNDICKTHTHIRTCTQRTELTQGKIHTHQCLLVPAPNPPTRAQGMASPCPGKPWEMEFNYKEQEGLHWLTQTWQGMKTDQTLVTPRQPLLSSFPFVFPLLSLLLLPLVPYLNSSWWTLHIPTIPLETSHYKFYTVPKYFFPPSPNMPCTLSGNNLKSTRHFLENFFGWLL